MSLVRTAKLKRSRKRLHSASVRAVLPEPTGPVGSARKQEEGALTSNANRERPLVPVAALIVRQVARGELARMIHVLVRMAVLLSTAVVMSVSAVRVRRRSRRSRAAQAIRERRDGLSHGTVS